MTTNSPYHIKIGVIRAEYVSGGIPGVNVSYSVKQIRLLLNKHLPFLKIPIDKQIPIVSEHLQLTQSGHEQRVWMFLRRMGRAVLKVFAVVSKQSVCPVFSFLICNHRLRYPCMFMVCYSMRLLFANNSSRKVNVTAEFSSFKNCIKSASGHYCSR